MTPLVGTVLLPGHSWIRDPSWVNESLNPWNVELGFIAPSHFLLVTGYTFYTAGGYTHV